MLEILFLVIHYIDIELVLWRNYKTQERVLS
jgi:hypothetical protein